ncbi:MAG TPA: amino acid adenylation domain-containing protein, partial [Herpetosiphonaceae bacterium]
GLYVEQLAITLEGRLDLPAFQRAWQQVVERHPIFRTAFVWEDLDEPLQLVRQQVRLPWQVEDWQDLPSAEQDARLDAFLAADRRRGFDLAEAPLMRLALFQVADARYRCVWTQHHLLLDGWSVPLVFNEVFAYYDAFAKGQDLYLAHPRPYHDYIAWLQQQDLAQAEAFWRQLLHGFTAPTPLIIDRPLAPDAGEARYTDQHGVVDEQTTAALQALARQHGLTLNTVVQGAWALLLSRYSGEPDVVFGATVAGRPADLPGVETMVGLFINTLPVRIHVPQQKTVLAWLQQVQQQQTELRQYEYSPLVQVQSWSEVPRGQPLFESLFAFENYPVGNAAAEQDDTPALMIANMEGQERTNYPLTIVAAPGPELSLRITFDNRRFDAATITRMIGHLQTILAGIAVHAERRISELPLVTAEEQQQLVVDWNNSAADYPRASSIQELFEAQAARVPSTVAVVCEGQQLSYGELNRRANQLAHHLRQLGVGPDVLVGICVERSLEMIVGILGILKAGGAYVPLDPNYPQDRLQYMLEDTRAPVLLTQERLRGQLPSGQARVVYLDADWEAISQRSAANPPRAVLGEHRAYIIYTSGSTGRPKGVMVKQRGLINLCYGLQAFFDDPDVSTTALITSISFDISVNQIFPTLIFGRTLHIIPDPIKFNSRAMVQYMAEHKIHLFDSVPSYLLAVLAEIQPVQVDNQLKYILIGGEKLERRLLQAVFDQLGEQVNIVNIYGLTEITDINLFSVITSRDLDKTITIGRPLNNNQVYLTDAHGNLQPLGVIGEVCVAGESLSRGYLNRPDLTAEKFVVCPWGDGALMCRTGDVGRRLPDGTIELFGRIDHQVKVRGFRIELGEVEAVLRSHPTVHEAVAVVREDMPGDQRLVAYIVEEPRTKNLEPGRTEQANKETKEQIGTGAPPSPAAAGEGGWGDEGLSAPLRAYLKERLPDYMVPSILVSLETLPLTPSGKVDRKALPAPNQSLSGAQTSRVDPRDTLELKLVQIWEDLLDIRPIGVTDSFFELGGHSLLVLRLMTQVKQQFGQDLPMATLFHGPTIEELACRMREHTGSDAWSPLVPLQPSGSRSPFFCVHPAGGPALCYARLAQHLGADQPVYGLQARGLEEGQEPVQRIEDMAADYIDAIRQIQPNGPYLLGGWSMGGLVAFEMAQQLRRQDQDVDLLALIDVGAPEGSAEIGDLDDDASILLALIEEQNLSMAKADFQQLGPGQQVDLAVELLKKSGFLPPDADQEQLRRMVQVFKTNLRAMFTYRPQLYPEAITLFKTAAPAAEDTSATEASPDLLETTLGWSGVSSQPVKVYTVPGTHETMVNEPHVRVLAERLKSCIDTLDTSVRSMVED